MVVSHLDADWADRDVASDFETGSEFRDARSEFSQTFATDVPGMRLTRVFPEPVNFLSQSGVWRQVDTALVERASGDGFRARSTGVKVEIGGTADAEELAAVRLPDGSRAAVSLQDATAAVPDLSGPTARFPEARPGVDVALAATPTGVKETLILGSVGATREFSFDLNLDGLVAELDRESGDVVLRDPPALPAESTTTSTAVGEPGPVRMRIPAGWMVDSNPDSSGGPARSEGVTYEVVNGPDGGQVLNVGLDGGWLDDPARVFPVRVDPTFTSETETISDTYVVEGEDPAIDHSGDPTLEVGVTQDGEDDPVAHRGLLHFDLNGTELETGGDPHIDIQFADVVLDQQSAATCPPYSNPMRLYAAPDDWDAPTEVWPGPEVDDGDKLLPDATGWGAMGACPTGEVHAQVTPIVQSWVDDTSEDMTANHGILLGAGDEDDPDQHWVFSSADTTESGTSAPYLSVAWTITDPAGPDAPSDLSPQGHLGSLTPAFIARYTHPTGAAGSLVFAIRIPESQLVMGIGTFSLPNGTPIALPSGQRASLIIDRGLARDVHLQWRVYSYNDDSGTKRTSPMTEWQDIYTPPDTGCGGVADPNEQNDTRHTATPLGIGTPVEGLICNDADVYTLNVETGTVTITLDNGATAGDLDMAIYDNTDGSFLALYDTTGTTETDDYEPGSYAIEIYGYRGASGPYTLDAEATP